MGGVTSADGLAGLDGTVGAALAAYDLGGEPRATLLHVSENVTYQVTDAAGGRRWALRLHRPGYHGVAEIRAELAWVEALRADAVVRTPAVVPTRTGAPVATVHAGPVERHAVLFEWVVGDSPQALAPDALPGAFGQLGEITARLHRHARHWSRPPGFTRFAWTWDTMLGAAGRWGSWADGLTGALTAAPVPVAPMSGAEMRAAVALVGRAVEVMRGRMAGFGTGPERFGLVHADMRLANLLIPAPAGDTIRDEVCVIDFDDCGFGWYLWDLAASLSFLEHVEGVGDLVAAWLAAYQRRLPLTAADVEMLSTFVLARRLLLVAWLGTHPHSDAVASVAEFARQSCVLADAYLAGRLLRDV